MNNLDLQALTHVRAVPRRWDPPNARDWAGVLGTFPLFTGVSKRRLRRLAGNATLAEFAPGETIVFPGDHADWLYVILAGHAKTTSDGRVLRVGEYFGELALIGGRSRSETVVATNYVHVMKLTSRSVLKLAGEHPAITLAMFRDLATRLRRVETEGARAAA